MRILPLLLVVSLNAGASGSQEIVVAKGRYYLDGEIAHNLSEFDGRFAPSEPVLVRACECAKTSRLTDLMDWLIKKGKDQIQIITVTSRELEICADCK